VAPGCGLGFLPRTQGRTLQEPLLALCESMESRCSLPQRATTVERRVTDKRFPTIKVVKRTWNDPENRAGY